MTASTVGFGWLAGLGAALFWAAPAFASAGGHLVYSAPQGCATLADFEARVAERGGHFDPYAAPDSGRELRVALVQTASGYLGTFQVVGPEGSSAIREVHGATCSEVVAALAVVSAIALRGEEDAASDQGPTDVPSPAPSPSPVPAPTPLPAPQFSPAVVAVQPQPTAQLSSEDGRLRSSSAVAGAKRVEVTAGTLRFDPARSITLFAGGELGILPSRVVPRYDLSISGANFVTTPDGKSYLAGVIPRFRLSYFGKGSYDVASAGGFGSTYQSLTTESSAAVSARGVGFGLGLCWSPTYDTRGFVALFCTEYGLGVMQLKSTSSYGTTMPYFASPPYVQTKSSAFQTAGVSFEGEYRLGSFFHLALKLGVDASLQQLTGERADGSQVFHSSTLLGYGMLGLGFHF